jgi:sec-independent protein translocase protein TatA
MWKPGVWELVIVLVIVLLVFGVGRLGKLGKDLGEGIREFRQGLTGGEGTSEEKVEETGAKEETA